MDDKKLAMARQKLQEAMDLLSEEATEEATEPAEPTAPAAMDSKMAMAASAMKAKLA